MSDLFISYSRADTAKASVLAQVLAQQGWSVWWDQAIPPGKIFDEVIEQALNAARCVIVLWSKESARSDWVKAEAAEAAKRRVLIPVLIEDVTVPFEFRRIQAANLCGWDGESRHYDFQKLLGSIAAILGETKERYGQTRVIPRDSEPVVTFAELIDKSKNTWTIRLSLGEKVAILVFETHHVAAHTLCIEGKAVEIKKISRSGFFTMRESYVFNLTYEGMPVESSITVAFRDTSLRIVGLQLEIAGFIVLNESI